MHRGPPPLHHPAGCPFRFLLFLLVQAGGRSPLPHPAAVHLGLRPAGHGVPGHPALHLHGGLPAGVGGAAGPVGARLRLRHGPLLQAGHPQLQHGVPGGPAAAAGGGGAPAGHPPDGAPAGGAEAGVCALGAGGGGARRGGVPHLRRRPAGGAPRLGEHPAGEEGPEVQEAPAHHHLLVHAGAAHVPAVARQTEIKGPGGGGVTVPYSASFSSSDAFYG